MVYLDWAATAKPREEIQKEALEESIKYYGNPSSAHIAGEEASRLLTECRNRCSNILNVPSETIYFTGGASDSNNTVILSFLKKHQKGEVISTSIEHPSVLEPVNQLKNFEWKSKLINPSEDGFIKSKKIIKAINENTRVISLIYVHNETGIIQPIDQIIKDIRVKEKEFKRPIHIHIDGVQAVGKIDIDLTRLDVDSFSASGHKFGAPKGIGILFLKNQRDVLYRGGGQENGIRPGTENMFGILSITKCLEASRNSVDKNKERLNLLMDRVINATREVGGITIPKTRKLSDSNFVPNIVSLSCPPVPGEVLARVLNSKGFMISTGSACSNNKKSNTKGILSMGISEKEGFSSFRVSIGWDTTEDEIENFSKALKESVKELAP